MKTNHFLSFLAIFALLFTFFACSNDELSNLQDGDPSSDSTGEAVKLCGGEEYDASIYRCEYGELVGKCKGLDYRPAYQVCNNGVIEDKDPSNPTPSSSSVQSASSVSSSSFLNSSSSVSSSSSPVCKSNDLGKGYDVIGSPYINWTKVNNIPVLDQDKMCKDGILELDKPGGAQQYASFSGNTIKEFYSNRNKNMKIDASVEGSIDIAWIFSVDFDAKFAMKTSNGSQQNQSLKYYYSQIRSYRYTGEDQIKSGSESAQNLKKYLTSSFISDLKSAKTAGQILDLYGSHIFIHYYKGGSLEANYTYLGSESSSRFTSASQMEIAAKGSFSIIDGKINYGTSNSNEAAISELEQHMSFNYETYGGKAIKASSLTQLGNEYGSWVSSIESNARITGIKDFAQSFVSIWDLAQQAEGVELARIYALKDEFKRRAEAQGAKFPVDDIIPCTPDDNNNTHYCSNGSLREYGSVADDAEKTYKTVVIGTQTWMAENLNYEANGSKCYDNDPVNCTTYGRLYEWETAMALSSNSSQISAKHKGICPAGYHIPTDADWDALLNAVGGSSTAGKYLKATFGWSNCGSTNSSSYRCEDKYGFSALPGGYRRGSIFIGSSSRWWSASDNGPNYAYYREILPNNEASIRNEELKSSLFSVRCVKN